MNTQDTGLSSQKVVGNILALGGGEVAVRVLAFIATAYLARTLGPTGFGVVGFALALAGYFSLSVHQGFLDIGSREVARHPDDARNIAASAIVARLGLALIAFCGLAIVAWALDKPLTVKLVLVLTGLSTFALALDTSWVYKGLERNRPVGLALALGQALYLGTVLVVVKGPADILFAPLALFLGELSAALLLAGALFRLGSLKIDLRLGMEVLKQSAFPTLSIYLRSLIFTFDVVLLGILLGEREVGLYSAPYRICFLLLALAVAIRASYLPAVTRAMAQGFQRVSEVVERSLELSSSIGIPAVVGGWVLATPLLHAIFGPEYAAAAWPFRLLLLSIGFIFIYAPIHNALVVHNLLRLEAFIIGSAAVLNVLLNLLLIPRYGLLGAASTTALSEGLILLMGFIAVRKLGVRVGYWSFTQALPAAAVMGIALTVFGMAQLGLYTGLSASIALGVVTYIVAMIILRNIPRDLRPYAHSLSLMVSQAATKKTSRS